MNKKILIITSCSLRHFYFAKTILNAFQKNIVKIILEVKIESNYEYKLKQKKDNLLLDHFNMRYNSELDFFSDSRDLLDKKSKILNIKKGEINDKKIVKSITSLKPDLIITYGCSIIRSNLLKLYKKRIINVHLGISPYYKGAGTNFHSLVNKEFQFMGYSFIYMDEGIDTGEIIHQCRADFFPLDNPHTIGNRLIKRMSHDIIKLITHFDLISEKKIIINNYDCKVFKIKDADFEKVRNLYKNFEKNLGEYIKKKKFLENDFPIIQQKFI